MTFCVIETVKFSDLDFLSVYSTTFLAIQMFETLQLNKIANDKQNQNIF